MFSFLKGLAFMQCGRACRVVAVLLIDFKPLACLIDNGQV